MSYNSHGSYNSHDSYNGHADWTSTTLHNDMNNAIMCLYSGTKEWIFVDSKSNVDKIEWWEESYDKFAPHRSWNTDSSKADPNKVDMLRFPTMAHVTYRRVTQHAGDCLFVPALEFHWVRSYGRNVGVSIMWDHRQRFDSRVYDEALAAGVKWSSVNLSDYQLSEPYEPQQGLRTLHS
eukprot:TRINITY_DN15503_c0_g1_i2.p1 TRINITY_DN15503_c0_g1~~TRINITY_DN15503_c0_g1_i2.p1  ORF type:complete len:178 (+),score=24.94 TRINITY_DN15503_c0_g1_i2:209-742(+)